MLSLRQAHVVLWGFEEGDVTLPLPYKGMAEASRWKNKSAEGDVKRQHRLEFLFSDQSNSSQV